MYDFPANTKIELWFVVQSSPDHRPLLTQSREVVQVSLSSAYNSRASMSRFVAIANSMHDPRRQGLDDAVYEMFRTAYGRLG